METSSATSSSNALALMRLMQMQAKTAQNLPGAGQSSPGASAQSAANTGAQGAQLSSSLLSALMGMQTAQPSASDLAASLIKTVDANDDGELSAGEISQALSPNGAAAPDVTQAFASLDTNGDGQLSQSELAAGVSNLQQQAGAAHHGRHHHHHGGGASSDALVAALTDDPDTDGSGSVLADEGAGQAAGAAGKGLLGVQQLGATLQSLLGAGQIV